MIRNYFKIAWRNIWRNKLISFINITGLTISLAFVGLIGIYIYSNLEIDSTQPKNLYRVSTAFVSSTTNNEIGSVGRALIPAIQQDVPEVQSVIPVREVPSSMRIKVKDHFFFDQMIYAGASFLTAFNFPLLYGNAETALKDPYSAVLTEETARKYFGSTDVVGKTILVEDSIPVKVTGVLKSLPPSHMYFDGLYSFDTWKAMGNDLTEWFTWDMYCYVTLKPGANVNAAMEKISALSMFYNGNEYRNNGFDVKHKLVPIRDIYLKSSLGGPNKGKGNSSQLNILSVIGLALLFLACINFINLTTAYQTERSKEVGVRKTLGAASTGLIIQFMVEAFVIVLLATVASFGIIAILLPVVERISGQTLSVKLFLSPTIIVAYLVLVLFTSLLSGWYPSLLLSKLNPAGVISKRYKIEGKGFSLRKALVVFQFSVSMILVIGTIIAAQQFRYIQKKELGFNKGAVIIINTAKAPYKSRIDGYETIKYQISQINGVRSVSGAAAFPGKYAWNGQVVQPEGYEANKSFSFEVIPADEDYTATLNIKMKAGRTFSKSFGTDAINGVLLNETACKQIGWKPDEAIGKRISTSGMDSGRVIGVMSDYNQHGLQSAINPILIFNGRKAYYNYIAVAAQLSNLKNTVTSLKHYWKQRFPGYPFEYTMLDEDISKQYKNEDQMATVVRLFSVLTIMIAALGLFGLTVFVAMQRTKEIGIRKVAGASVTSIVRLLSSSFIKLVLLAIMIATPIAWWLMNKWLAQFAYRIDIEWWMPGIAGLTTVGIALLTVSFQAIKAALSNPVKALRSE